jgi:putative N6-adenine-specific DNA methylase
MATRDHLRLIGTPGSNNVMAAELVRLAQRALGPRPPTPHKAGSGVLVYPFEPALAAVAASYHRTATRVLWDLFASDARRLEPLYDEIAADMRSDQRAWLWDGASISVRARNVKPFAAGERQVVGTIKNALIDGARARGLSLHVDPDAPDIHVTVRMHDDTVLVSLDLAGASLSHRGYRVHHGAAPLREHLAAVLLMLARHDARSEILLDPMCGAGTICIEAALMATAAPLRPPEHAPAYLRLPVFARGTDASQQPRPLFPDTRASVIGNDVDGRALQAAQTNARAAGVDVTWLRGDFRKLTREQVEQRAAGTARAEAAAGDPAQHPGQRGLILCNPPYGHRLGDDRDDDRVLDLYRDLGGWCDQFHGWRAAFLVANRDFEHAFGRRARIRKPLDNGALPAYFYLYEL